MKYTKKPLTFSKQVDLLVDRGLKVFKDGPVGVAGDDGRDAFVIVDRPFVEAVVNFIA